MRSTSSTTTARCYNATRRRRARLVLTLTLPTPTPTPTPNTLPLTQVPFDLFDPFGLSKNASPEKKAKGLLAEINNGEG